VTQPKANKDKKTAKKTTNTALPAEGQELKKSKHEANTFTNFDVAHSRQLSILPYPDTLPFLFAKEK